MKRAHRTKGPLKSLTDRIACGRCPPFASLPPAVALLLSLALGACGGGSGGGTSPSYTIGGDLTGLAGGQQITLHNGIEALQLTANGGFTFSAKVVDGGNYSVTVVAQPVGQNCVVVNGIGTGVNANVSNVSVSCTYQPFALGGNLTGLPSGQQITLENNGADPITIAANGAFTFSSPSHYFDAYSVSVSAQPGPSNEFCSVENGSGTISGAVTNVQITCATEVVLYNFTGADSANGLNPVAGLLLDGAGNLYGAANNVFELTPAGGGGYTESVVASNLSGAVIMDSAGSLYGTSLSGGSGGFGVVFKLSPSPGGGYTESDLYSFSGSTLDGGEPAGDLLMDSAGNLYGTTSIGGSYQAGTVFKLSPSSGGNYAYSILYSFTGTTVDGGQPNGGLVMDDAGNLYGTTMTSSLPPGGNVNDSGFGTVFKLTPTGGSSYQEKTLHIFHGLDGVAPTAGLIMDSSGNLYGTTHLSSSSPTSNGAGLVFKLTPDANGVYTESILYSFTGGSEGGGPLAALVMDSAGNLYGTASYGGGGSANCNNGCGTIFKLTAGTSGNYTESTLYSFAGASGGGGPAARLIMDAAGNLYGTTFSGNGINVTGGADAGNVFEILLH
ncbi:MAG TPA: choice-of-anchor tandem repeat GloVer-containing protein [Steroidobacteraceae bacterium]|jgi:uncharacterized repeat protein (TIGR03803 family)|nr:choice-of-anchor tandem repeat GloVer-containing protein [Steroidobacteraceae bacterium]